MFIGDTEIAIVSDIELIAEAEVDEINSLNSYQNTIDHIPKKHEKKVEEINIIGYLNSEAHSQKLHIDNQKKEIKNLRKKSVEDNFIEWKGYKGHLLVEEVDFLEDSESRIVNLVEITGRFYFWPKYYSEVDI